MKRPGEKNHVVTVPFSSHGDINSWATVSSQGHSRFSRQFALESQQHMPAGAVVNISTETPIYSTNTSLLAAAAAAAAKRSTTCIACLITSDGRRGQQWNQAAVLQPELCHFTSQQCCTVVGSPHYVITSRTILASDCGQYHSYLSWQLRQSDMLRTADEFT